MTTPDQRVGEISDKHIKETYINGMKRQQKHYKSFLYKIQNTCDID